VKTHGTHGNSFFLSSEAFASDGICIVLDLGTKEFDFGLR
jgi:hypothetical protein